MKYTVTAYLSVRNSLTFASIRDVTTLIINIVMQAVMCESCRGLDNWVRSYIRPESIRYHMIEEIWKKKMSLKYVRSKLGPRASKQIYEAKEYGLITVNWKKDTIETTLRGRWLYLAAHLRISPISLLELSIAYCRMKICGFYIKDIQEFYSPHIPFPSVGNLRRRFKELADAKLVRNVRGKFGFWEITDKNMEMLSKYHDELNGIYNHQDHGCALCE